MSEFNTRRKRGAMNSGPMVDSLLCFVVFKNLRFGGVVIYNSWGVFRLIL